MTKDVTAIADKVAEMVAAIIPLANSNDFKEDAPDIYRIIQSSLRKNIMRMQAINLLSVEEKLGDSALEVSRNMIEDAVSIDYILSDDNPEKLAKRFYAFLWVQLKEDAEYYKSVGVDSQEEAGESEELINTKFQEVITQYPDFLHKDGTPKHSWSSRNVDMMLNKIKKKGILDESQIPVITRVYVRGSRKSHFNPSELINYLDQSGWDAASRDAMRIALVGAASALVRLTTRYVDIVSHYKGKHIHYEVAHKVNELLGQIQVLDMASE